MAVKDRPAWTGRYLWRPRHSRDEASGGVNRRAIGAVSAAGLAIGAAAYVGFRDGDDDRHPAATGTLPTTSLVVPYASIPVSVLPAPATSTYSAAPLPSAVTSKPAATSEPGRPARTTVPPGWQERTIVATSVLSAGQSWATNRLR